MSQNEIDALTVEEVQEKLVQLVADTFSNAELLIEDLEITSLTKGQMLAVGTLLTIINQLTGGMIGE